MKMAVVTQRDRGNRAHSWCFWLTEGRDPVAYLSVSMTYGDSEEDIFGEARPTIGCLEVHPQHRGRGLTPTLLAAASAHLEAPLWSTGTFSVAGYAARNKHMRLLPGATVVITPGDKAFVKSWDAAATSLAASDVDWVEVGLP